MAKKFRGLRDEQLQSRQKLIRDTRPLVFQIFDVLNNSRVVGGILVTFALCVLVPPFTGLYIVFCPLGIIMFAFRRKKSKKDGLPFRIPLTEKVKDPSDPIPGTKRSKFAKAGGAFLLGNEYQSQEELWLKNNDILTHMLILGTTGSGKTETLVSLSFNAVAMGSGFFYIDPKAAPKLALQIYIISRICGRDDDFRILDFLTGSRSRRGKTPQRISNTNNPFAFGSADSLTQLLVSLMPPSEGGNAIFAQNGQQLITSLMNILVDLRDQGKLHLSIETVRSYATAQQMDALARRDDVSDFAILSLKSFLNSVGWQEDKPYEKQGRNFGEQFSYARAYFGLALQSFADTYGHIYNVSMGEVDMYDVIKNRRILVTLLPSLEKAQMELQQLGKINLSAVRNATAIGLGSEIEGTVDDVLNSLPTNSSVPFLSITDEYAAIPTPGYAEVLTQGRGLGISAIVASQDYAGITKADEKGVEAKQIVSNTKVKICMTLEDPEDTYELFNKIAGEGDIMQTDGFTMQGQGGNSGHTLNYRDQQNAKIEKVNRINLRDLQEQIEGEFHAFFKGKVVRGFSFYADPPLENHMQLRINQFLQVDTPDEFRLNQKYNSFHEFKDILKEKINNSEDGPGNVDDGPMKLQSLFDVYQNETSFDRNRDMMGKAITAFMNFVNVKESNIQKFREDNSAKHTTRNTAAQVAQKINMQNEDSKDGNKQAVRTRRSSPLQKQFVDSDKTYKEQDNARSRERNNISVNVTPDKPEESGRRKVDQIFPEKEEKVNSEHSKNNSDVNDNKTDESGSTMENEAVRGVGAIENRVLGDVEEAKEDFKRIEEKSGVSREDAERKSEEMVNRVKNISEEYLKEPLPEKGEKKTDEIYSAQSNVLSKMMNKIQSKNEK